MMWNISYLFESLKHYINEHEDWNFYYWHYLCNYVLMYISCIKSLASARKPATNPEPLTHLLILSAQDKTLSLQRVRTKSEELTQDTLVSHTANRKSSAPVIQLREPAWVVSHHLLSGKPTWHEYKVTQCPTGKSCLTGSARNWLSLHFVYKMSMHIYVYFSHYIH